MLLRLILAVILIYILYRLVKGLILFFYPRERVAPEQNHQRPKAAGQIGEELVEDSWCHTYVPITDAVALKENGRTTFFCSRECMEQYKKSHGGNT